MTALRQKGSFEGTQSRNELADDRRIHLAFLMQETASVMRNGTTTKADITELRPLGMFADCEGGRACAAGEGPPYERSSFLLARFGIPTSPGLALDDLLSPDR
jgi:hypothetical protein